MKVLVNQWQNDDLTNLTPDETPLANSEAAMKLYEFAAQQNVPVSLHSNIAAVESSENWGPLESKRHYFDEVLDAFSKNPNTTFIWCHSGISRRIFISDLPEVLDKLLATYNNVYCDISWVIFEDYLVPLRLKGEPDPKFIKLFEKYPNRFMIGTDIVARFSPDRDPNVYKPQVRKYETILKKLRPSTARKMATENAYRLLPKKGMTLQKSCNKF